MAKRSRSLLSDLRLGFSLGALLLGFATALFTDVTLRHAMEAERSATLNSEGHYILRLLETREDQFRTLAPPESSQVDWSLVDGQGSVMAQSAGGAFLNSVPWGSVHDDPIEYRPDRRHLYSAVALDSPIGTLRIAMDRSSEISVVSHLRRDLALLLLVLAVAAAGLGHLIAKHGLRPLRQIRDETARIEAQDLHRRLDATAFPEELADLASALNGALARLERAFSRLEAFSSDLAHELRTPLQNFRSELEGLVLRPPKDLNLPEAMGSLLEELHRLDKMVDQILFLARSTAGAEVDRQFVAAGAMLQEASAFFGGLAEDVGVAFSIQADPSCLLHADPKLVQRALINLVANALRHTPPGGCITLSARPLDQAAEIAVSDTGTGIPPDMLPRLGDRFLRIHSDRARNTGGAGLGLAIVKGICELHGGSFSVESIVDQGTTVKMTFPDPA